jgi:hypothetical protein
MLEIGVYKMKHRLEVLAIVLRKCICRELRIGIAANKLVDWFFAVIVGVCWYATSDK